MVRRAVIRPDDEDVKALVSIGVREDLALIDVERTKGDRTEARAKALTIVNDNDQAFTTLHKLTVREIGSLRDRFAAERLGAWSENNRLGCDLYLLATEG